MIEGYRWASNAKRYGLHLCDPMAVKDLFDKLSKKGELNTTRILTEARKKGSPLHDAPGWCWDNDEVAADRYRLNVAGAALAGLKVVYREKIDGEHQSVPVQAYVEADKSSLHGRGGESYKPVGDVLADPIERAKFLVQLLSEVRRIEKIYSILIAATPEVGRRWIELRHTLERVIEDPSEPPSAPL